MIRYDASIDADAPYQSLELSLKRSSSRPTLLYPILFICYTFYGVHKIFLPVVCPYDIQEVLDAIFLPEMLPIVLDNRGQVLDVSCKNK